MVKKRRIPIRKMFKWYWVNYKYKDRMILKLSDAFQIPEGVVPALECSAVMLNINYGHNKELLEKCKRLKDYSIFTSKVRAYTNSGVLLKDAIDKAMDECVEEGVLVDILLKHRTLARNTLLTEYDEKKRRKLDRKEGFEDGVEQTLLRIITKKVNKNLTLDRIAADLEEDVEVIRPIYETAKRKTEEDI